MKKKGKITVGGTEYTVVTHENAEYTQKLAEEVDECIQDMCTSSRISITAAAILTAVNFCDRLKKYEQEADSLGEQIEGYLHAASQQLARYDELKKENEKLKKDIAIYRKRLKEECTVVHEPAPISSSVKAANMIVDVPCDDEAADDEAAFFNAFK